MKKILSIILAFCIILVSAFGLFASLSVNENTANDSDLDSFDVSSAEERIENARNGLEVLIENQPIYLAGADDFSDGLLAYNEAT